MNGPGFRAFTTKFPGLAYRIISDIGISGAYDPNSPPQVIPPQLDSRALWDTGASWSVITRDLARRLALIPTGEVEVNHAGGTTVTPTYIVNFVLPNKVKVPGVMVTELPDQPADFEVLVGMDLIRLGDLSITNVGGKTTMSFRIPSMHTIDYVDEGNPG